MSGLDKCARCHVEYANHAVKSEEHAFVATEFERDALDYLSKIEELLVSIRQKVVWGME